MTPQQAIDMLTRAHEENPDQEIFVQWIGREHGYEDRFTQAQWDEGVLQHEGFWFDQVSELTGEIVEANAEDFVDYDEDEEDDESEKAS